MYTTVIDFKINEYEKKINELKKQLKELEENEKELKNEKALIMHHEKLVTRSEQLFKWTERAGHVSESVTYFEYNTPKYEFSISLKERTDLKVWKYEVKANASSLKFEMRYNDYTYHKDYYSLMQKYIKHTYNREKNIRETHEITATPTKEKFKTREKALDYVKQWQRIFLADYREEITKEKELFFDIRRSYNDHRIIVYISDYNERTALKEYTSLLGLYCMEKRTSDNIIIGGENALEKVKELITKYGFKAEIRAC